MKSIFERELAGELISTDDPEYQQILDIITETMNTCRELNSGVHTSEENLEYLSRIIGKEVDESVFFMPPFYVDYGKNISIGKGVVIQQLCTFMDRGGITIEDGVEVLGLRSIMMLSPVIHVADANKRSHGDASAIGIELR